MVKKERGITLIALVITIIVLLILAGITIASLSGDNGILTRAKEARDKTQIGSIIESAKMDILEEQVKNDGEITESELQKVFSKYFENIPADLPDNFTETTVHTKDEYGDYYIKVSDIWNGNGGSGGETGNLPSTAETSPFLPDSNSTVIEDDLDKGVVVKDSKNNEWTWIVVPKSVTASSTTDGDIENALIGYATKYRGSYTDTWYEGCGLSESEYPQKYSTMLQSIKANGGFYIGKYEVGSFDNPVTSDDNTRQAVIQQGAYPYNYVTCSQAEEIAEGLAIGGNTSSLMFGLQWDLVLAYLETKGVSESELKTNSDLWGNYRNIEFTVTEGNKYAIVSNFNLGEWNDVPVNYLKPIFDTNGNGVLLSTGATERNRKMNIYDLAGNVWELTLEKNTSTDYPCVFRGGYYFGTGAGVPVSYRGSNSSSNSDSSVGFRPSLY